MFNLELAPGIKLMNVDQVRMVCRQGGWPAAGGRLAGDEKDVIIDNLLDQILSTTPPPPTPSLGKISFSDSALWGNTARRCPGPGPAVHSLFTIYTGDHLHSRLHTRRLFSAISA